MTKQNEAELITREIDTKIIRASLIILLSVLIMFIIYNNYVSKLFSSVPHEVCENVIVSSKPINEYTYHIWESLVPYFNINEKMYNVSYEIIEKRIDCAEINETFVDGHIERNLNTTKCPVKYIKYSMNELKEVCKWE